jgi:hexosaminidase
MHLDVCRHFFPVSFVKKYIDLLAIHKMNYFHWHLTEDQGWRIEIKKYPLLTQTGAWRSGSMIGKYSDQKYDSVRYGGFYTQDEIRDIVKYASERHITVIPEIEMPGHALAALAAYPQFSCKGGPFEVARGWGVFDDVYCTREETFRFLFNVLDEVIELFPGPYIHIGGDECPKTRWKSCDSCQSRMREEGIKDEHELQSWFIQRIERYVNEKGKKIIGWDEILEGGLAPNATVMSWRGTEGGIMAANQNHNVVMTPGTHCYFDHYQGNPEKEPLAIGGFTNLEKVFSFNPLPAGLPADKAEYILGAQANVWTEYILTESHIEYMVLPRMTALSQVLWSGDKKGSFENFEKGIYLFMEALKKQGYNYRKP